MRIDVTMVPFKAILFAGALIALAYIVSAVGEWLHAAFGVPADSPWKVLAFGLLAFFALVLIGGAVSIVVWTVRTLQRVAGMAAENGQPPSANPAAAVRHLIASSSLRGMQPSDAVAIAAGKRAGFAEYEVADPIELGLLLVGAGRSLLNDDALSAEQCRALLLNHWNRNDEVAQELRLVTMGSFSADPSTFLDRSAFDADDSWESGKGFALLAFNNEFLDRLLREGLPDEGSPRWKHSRWAKPG